MDSSVTIRRDGAVAVLTLNEPDTRNAISPGITNALVEHCRAINADLSVGCVVLTGAGKGFSSGGNVKEMRDRAGNFAGSAAEIRRGYQHGIQKIALAMYDLEAPVIAAVNGAAIGAGCDLALMCDIRIAAEDAQFAESFVRLGLVSGDGGGWFLPRVVGLSRAYQMTFTGDAISAATALEWGLVAKVAPSEALVEEAMSLARRIAANPVHSLRLTKKLLRESMAIGLPAHLEMAAGMQALVQSTQDQAEAVNAFFEKRAPVFEGR
jgi:enoyl-CoA hydratase/carnithine racemase